MKRQVIILVSAVILSLLVVPAVNILSAPDLGAVKWRRSYLYNMDFASRWAARLLYPFGISNSPGQVIIGYDDWLYLGDQYDQTRSVDRRPQADADLERGRLIGDALVRWETYLTRQGVKLFRVMVSPNKGTVYPEYLPAWARPAEPNATDALIAGAGTQVYIDLRPALRAAKATQPAPLYYKTDTHWNSLGAGAAFRAFAQQIAPVAPELKWPADPAYTLTAHWARPGGDLANFLRLSAQLPDVEPGAGVLDLAVETTRIDFDTGKVLGQGGNPRIDSPHAPLLVESKGALNQVKVLWLRDSFGTAMAPYMAATYSHVLQLHWREALKPNGRMVQLIEGWKPDYVFVTVVERESRAAEFMAFPPPLLLPRMAAFEAIRTTVPASANHLTGGAAADEYAVVGDDPFVEFSLADPVLPAEARYLDIGLACADGQAEVPLQFFWLEEGRPHYDEEHSARFVYRPGLEMLDLQSVPRWVGSAPVTRIRVDVDARGACSQFRLGRPSLGMAREAEVPEG